MKNAWLVYCHSSNKEKLFGSFCSLLGHLNMVFVKPQVNKSEGEDFEDVICRFLRTMLLSSGFENGSKSLKNDSAFWFDIYQSVVPQLEFSGYTASPTSKQMNVIARLEELKIRMEKYSA